MALLAVRRAAARLLLAAGPFPCSNRSISPGRRAHSSKPAAACGGRMGQTDNKRQTDGRTDARQMHRPCSAHSLYVGSASIEEEETMWSSAHCSFHSTDFELAGLCCRIVGRFVYLYCSMGWDDSCQGCVPSGGANARNDGYKFNYKLEYVDGFGN